MWSMTVCRIRSSRRPTNRQRTSTGCHSYTLLQEARTSSQKCKRSPTLEAIRCAEIGLLRCVGRERRCILGVQPDDGPQRGSHIQRQTDVSGWHHELGVRHLHAVCRLAQGARGLRGLLYLRWLPDHFLSQRQRRPRLPPKLSCRHPIQPSVRAHPT